MGLLSKGLVYLAIATAGAAFATRPGIDEVRVLFRERLAAQIADGSILPSDNGAAQALLAVSLQVRSQLPSAEQLRVSPAQALLFAEHETLQA